MFAATLVVRVVAIGLVCLVEGRLLLKQSVNVTEHRTPFFSPARLAEALRDAAKAAWGKKTTTEEETTIEGTTSGHDKKRPSRKHHKHKQVLKQDPIGDVVEARWHKYLKQIPWGTYHKKRKHECPPMMVFIMSSRVNRDRRRDIREMWSETGGWGSMTTKFAICQHPADDDEDSEVFESLEKEAELHNDLLYLNCHEGYLRGALTQKVLEAMKEFVSPEENWAKKHELFMKTDDDSFVSPSRLCDFLSTHRERAKSFAHSYIGVFAEAGERIQGKRPPCRDPESPWYEPYEKFKEDFYPPAAKGGPGYILSRDMVQTLISEGIAEANVLNNEDRAVGVWVDELKKNGMPIEYINLPGTDGYEDYHANLIAKNGPWSEYPYAIHHHLTGSEIKCLHHVDKAGESKRFIDECFATQNSNSMFIATPLLRRSSEASLVCRGSVP